MAEILLSFDGECQEYQPNDCNPDTELLELTPEYNTLLSENPVTFMPQVDDALATEVRERLQYRHQACIPFWSQNVSVRWGRTDAESIAETLRGRTPEDIKAFMAFVSSGEDLWLVAEVLDGLATDAAGIRQAIGILNQVGDKKARAKILDGMAQKNPARTARLIIQGNLSIDDLFPGPLTPARRGETALQVFLQQASMTRILSPQQRNLIMHVGGTAIGMENFYRKDPILAQTHQNHILTLLDEYHTRPRDSDALLKENKRLLHVELNKLVRDLVLDSYNIEYDAQGNVIDVACYFLTAPPIQRIAKGFLDQVAIDFDHSGRPDFDEELSRLFAEGFARYLAERLVDGNPLPEFISTVDQAKEVAMAANDIMKEIKAANPMYYDPLDSQSAVVTYNNMTIDLKTCEDPIKISQDMGEIPVEFSYVADELDVDDLQLDGILANGTSDTRSPVRIHLTPRMGQVEFEHYSEDWTQGNITVTPFEVDMENRDLMELFNQLVHLDRQSLPQAIALLR